MNQLSETIQTAVRTFPFVKEAYSLCTDLVTIFMACRSNEQAFKKLALRYNRVEDFDKKSSCCYESILNVLQETYLDLVRFLLLEGVLDYFELPKIVEGLTGLHIHLEEKNLPPFE